MSRPGPISCSLETAPPWVAAAQGPVEPRVNMEIAAAMERADG
jgi:hypothetical protein